MAGNGPAPKDRAARRNHHEPARGEWINLRPLEKPVLPALPKRAKGEGPWPAATKAAWAAWRQDPVTSQYSVSDIAYAIDTIRLHAEMTPSTANEVRLRMDALGLTPKGKRDNRWRIVADEDEAPRADEQRPTSAPRRADKRRARLTVVAS